MASSSVIPADRRWIQASGGFILLVAAFAVIGRWSGIDVLVNWLPGQSAMVPSAATAFGLLAAGLFALAREARKTMLLCGVLVCVLGGLKVGLELAGVHRTGDLAGWRGELDHFGRMASDTAVALVLAGIVLALRAVFPSLRNLIAALAGMIAALAFLPLLQYGAWLVSNGTRAGYHGMAVPTSFCFIALAAAIVRVERTPSEGALSFMSAALGVMFSIGMATIASNHQLVESNREVTRTYAVRAALSSFVEQVARAESSSRGYALTGQPYFRDRVEVHEKEALRLLDEVQPEISGNPAQLERILRIRKLAEEKSAQNARLLSARAGQGTPAAAEYLSSLLAIPGQPSSNLVVLAGQMVTEEEVLLADRTNLQQALERDARLVQISGSVIAAALLVSAIVFTRRASMARRAAEAQFRRSFEDAGIGMALVGLDGSWLRMNRSVLELLGYSEEELAGRTFQQITHPDDLAADLSLVNDLIQGRARTYQLEKRYLHRKGHIVWGNLTVSIVRSAEGAPLHFISQIEDITARKRLEKELRSARDDALAAVRVKSEFLATMSHEIRTPLNGVLGMTNLLLESNLNPEQLEMIQTVESCGENLLRVLNDVLDFSTMEAGKLALHPSWFSLQELIAETLALYTPQAAGKAVGLAPDFGPGSDGLFWGDSGRIKQVLNNLVGNALKFTERGRVVVAARLAREESTHAVMEVRVEDTGIGIAPEDQNRLFRTFSQLDGSDRRKYGGTGLGLAICKRIVELMDGEIGLTSDAGAGSSFWFRLPLRRGEVSADSAAAGVRSATPNALIGTRILVAEDNVPGQLVARRTLAQMGYLVDVVATGEAVFTQLTKQRYDAIVMDCQMPGMDGYETTRRIRDGLVAGVDRRIPIIALTASAFPEDEAKCLAAGMDEFLSKPLRSAELGAALLRAGRAKRTHPGSTSTA